MKKLQVLQLFSGIGAQAMALQRVGIPFESDICEINKFSVMSYEALFGPTFNLGDITKVQRFEKHYDLVFWSYPCQSLSMAGKREGMEEGSGTESSLGWEVIRLVREAHSRNDAPDVLIMENVPGVHDKANIQTFKKMISALADCGYVSQYQDLNAMDYGVPQTRKRCFMVSCRDGTVFKFPKPIPLTECMRDRLETSVDDRYYLSAESIANYVAWDNRQRERGNGFKFNVTDGSGVASALTRLPTRGTQNFISIKEREREIKLVRAGTLEVSKLEMKNRVYSSAGVSPTLTSRRDDSKILRE